MYRKSEHLIVYHKGRGIISSTLFSGAGGMYQSCKYCGRIHPMGYQCPKKPTKANQDSRAFQFRSTREWKAKREEIKQRDIHLCQICLRNLYGTQRQYNGKETQVHHIDPIAQAWDIRLDNENLITLCPYHHDLAERGKIPKTLLRKIAAEQEVSPRGV